MPGVWQGHGYDQLVCCPANNVHLSASYPGSCGQARRGGIAVAIATSRNTATRRGSRRERCIICGTAHLARTRYWEETLRSVNMSQPPCDFVTSLAHQLRYCYLSPKEVFNLRCCHESQSSHCRSSTGHSTHPTNTTVVCGFLSKLSAISRINPALSVRPASRSFRKPR